MGARAVRLGRLNHVEPRSLDVTPRADLSHCMVGAGDGKRGKKQFQAPLADPYAEPNEALVPVVEDTLRSVTAALLADTAEAAAAAAATAATVPEAQRAGIAKSLSYLRDRVGVPRDMSYPAAMHFRAYLNLHIAAMME